MTELCRRLEQNQIAFSENCPMAKYNSFRIGGKARLAIFPSGKQELLKALTAVGEADFPFAVMGRGSNLLVPDEGYCGAVICTSGCEKISLHGRVMDAEAGASLVRVAALAKEASLTGAEFAGGIPGTVGGGILMNAGAFGGSMEQITVSSEYWDRRTGLCGMLDGAEHRFGKRTSVYGENPDLVILSAVLRFEEGISSEIEGRMQRNKEKRRSSQPLEYPNAGSIFKHPAGNYAGRMIEECGLKGLAVGGAEVSQKHAGFIINKGEAKAQDVQQLIGLIRKRVFEAYGILLECELRMLGGEPL